MENVIVKCNHVSKRFGMRYAVRDLDFQLPKGQVIGLIGPNGSGKSTTLRMMVGLIQPSEGELLVQDKPVHRRISPLVSYMSDSDTLYSFYTVEQMIDFYNSVFADFDIEKAKDMLSFMKLEPRRSIKELSKGNLGRLKMVLTLSRRAPLILMDEPLTGLDPMVRKAILKGLVSYVDFDAQTVVMSTHDVAEIEPVLDTVLLMSGGRLIDMQAVDQIRTTYNKSVVDWMSERVETVGS